MLFFYLSHCGPVTVCKLAPVEDASHAKHCLEPQGAIVSVSGRISNIQPGENEKTTREEGLEGRGRAMESNLMCLGNGRVWGRWAEGVRGEVGKQAQVWEASLALVKR